MTSTARIGLDAANLVAFLDHHATYTAAGHPCRTRKQINGRPVEPDTDARTIRRWRSRGGTVTKYAAQRMLAKYDLRLGDYVYWCQVHSLAPTVRGTI